MTRALVFLVGLCCLWSACAQAQVTVLMFEDDPPAPQHYLLSIIASTGATEDLTVPPSAPGACASLPGATPTTMCATLPACLPPGIWTFLVAAVDGSSTSPSSAPMTCVIQADVPCTCTTTGDMLRTVTAPQRPVQQTPSPVQATTPDLHDVRALLNVVPVTARGTPLAGPELLEQALQVTAAPITQATPT